MIKIALLAVLALVSCGAACTTRPPASDVSGAGFVLEKPNAEMRAAMVKIDRPFAEAVAVNRETCLKLPGCRKD